MWVRLPPSTPTQKRNYKMKKEDNKKNTEKQYSLPRVSQMSSGDDSVLIDLGRIRTEEEINSNIDNAIKKRKEKKIRER